MLRRQRRHCLRAAHSALPRTEKMRRRKKLAARHAKKESAPRRPKQNPAAVAAKAELAPAPSQAVSPLTHLDQRGQARMVDVTEKGVTERIAVAEGRVIMRKETLDTVLEGNAMKGDVLGAARLAGIMAAKRTHGLIPLCHPLPLTKVEIEINPRSEEHTSELQSL